MKISYSLFNMDVLALEHLKRSIEFDTIDLLYSARQDLERLDNSRLSKVITGDVKTIIETMKDRSRLLLDNVNKMFKLDIVDKGGGNALVTLFVSPDYFVVGDCLEARFGRLGKRILRFQTRQGIIDGIEKSLRQTYDIPFVGKILEDDGKNLRIGNNK